MVSDALQGIMKVAMVSASHCDFWYLKPSNMLSPPFLAWTTFHAAAKSVTLVVDLFLAELLVSSLDGCLSRSFCDMRGHRLVVAGSCVVNV